MEYLVTISHKFCFRIARAFCREESQETELSHERSGVCFYRSYLHESSHAMYNPLGETWYSNKACWREKENARNDASCVLQKTEAEYDKEPKCQQ